MKNSMLLQIIMMGSITFFSLSCAVSDSLFSRMKGNPDHHAQVTWTVVGAGPAGIAIIGILLDLGVDERTIRWIDPEFNVGRLGKYYYNVPGNAKVRNYIKFLDACNTFKMLSTPSIERLRASDVEEACVLERVIDALQDITYYLLKRIVGLPHKLVDLSFEDDNWSLRLNDGTYFTSHNVVMATGSHPRILDYPVNEVVPLDLALDKATLAGLVSPNDTIAVVGGSHSAILVLKYLYELRVKRVINLFKHPIRYFYDMGSGNQVYLNGLKGTVAEWAFHVLEKKQPVEIFRVLNTDAARNSWLPVCNKIIYAVGYERNELPFLNFDTELIDYDSTTGTIAPRLFGIGLAFPEQVVDELGEIHQLIGVIDFMNYAQKIVPAWMKPRSCSHFHEYDSLFRICLL